MDTKLGLLFAVVSVAGLTQACGGPSGVACNTTASGACASSTAGSDIQDQAPAGPQNQPKPGDSGPDAGPASSDCHPIPSQACSSQADCRGQAGATQVLSCLPGPNGNVCTFEGQYSSSCAPIEPMVQLDAEVDGLAGGSAAPQALYLRVYYPTAADGSSVTCARIGSEAATPGGEDSDSSLNVMSQAGYAVSQPGASTIQFPGALVATSGAVIYLEAWSGGLDSNAQLPTGSRLGAGCLDNQTINASLVSLQKIALTVNPD